MELRRSYLDNCIQIFHSEGNVLDSVAVFDQMGAHDRIIGLVG
jgi:hypothetical protein